MCVPSNFRGTAAECGYGFVKAVSCAFQCVDHIRCVIVHHVAAAYEIVYADIKKVRKFDECVTVGICLSGFVI